jgi:AmmeMemoRadiSam system protein A
VDLAVLQREEVAFGTVGVDEALLYSIQKKAGEAGYGMSWLRDLELDHGTSVPLYFLLKNGWHGNVVALGYSFLSNADHVRFGYSIKEAIDKVGHRTAFVASGDLSHRLKLDAPAGYNPKAHVFDEEVVSAVREGTLQQIELIDDDLRKVAGECGFRSMLVAIGTTRELMLKCEVLNYEAPFGVGYMVAQLAADNDVLSELPRIARRAVEVVTRSGQKIDPPQRLHGLLATRAPCFVSLKTKDGDLRGCIGTIEATKDTLAEEIIANAISAAQSDPRFDRVNGDELENLQYSVDVLLESEPAKLEDLDPEIYGVIVEDESGKRRGLLLPDIQGIKTTKDQVRLARRKADIGADEAVNLFRFKVLRFRE